MSEQSNWVSWFRHASPYIKKHQNTTMVMALSGEVVASSQLENLTHDVALLNSLGVRLVLVLGGRPQINSALRAAKKESDFHKGMRVTSPDLMPYVVSAYGQIRTELEAKLSMGVINSPMQGGGVKVSSGNLVMAKPVGVLDGIDFGCTGKFRRLDIDAVKNQLDSRSIVLIPALGYSTTGEVFNLESGELAACIASELGAQKLILFGSQIPQSGSENEIIRQMALEQAEDMVVSDQSRLTEEQFRNIEIAIAACKLGVNRTHIVSYQEDDALLRELFTRDGSGTMLAKDSYDEIRQANLHDINGILELIRPLEEQGILVRRSRERLESELDAFWVNVRDNAVVACAALYPLGASGSVELSCFAVDELYQKGGRGGRLMKVLEQRALEQGIKRIYVLTTQTEHWFRERGFAPSDWEELPESKRYNHDRKSKVLVKEL